MSSKKDFKGGFNWDKDRKLSLGVQMGWVLLGWIGFEPYYIDWVELDQIFSYLVFLLYLRFGFISFIFQKLIFQNKLVFQKIN